MPRELSVFGALMPSLLFVFVFSLLLQWGVDHLSARFGLYRHIWNPPLLRLAVFVCLFCTLGLLALN
ncbi:DUF1656 domain-containing protein [Acidihalobacter ferrooxydans]|uniref:DUF1656 domain-containing protein n=1 Tax=Acidihalobacter ferrooxydans TaxID=1765967 RepID=A0A1P8UED2_9GAMM|nr:DUF1656 domain-containing protein [Acidihalobacter ferrooxydans]APZ42207.1 DUF1656 domain-containing protein [Acidihalobacter ferrooxydans]